MSDMSGALQNRIAPPVSKYNSIEYSDAKVESQTERQSGETNQTEFKDLIANSQDEIKKKRESEELGDLSASSDAEFFEKLAQQTKQKREVKKEMDKDDFLKLFVSQLQNQDPLNPDDGTEMASKLAQFNGLEQMMNMNTTMAEMVKSQSVGRNLQLVNYVGKEIAIDGGRAVLKDGKLSRADFEVPTQVSRTSLTIRNSNGAIVAEKEMGPLNQGTHQLAWDGLGKDGKAQPGGLYHFSISAKDIEGNEVDVPIKSKTVITGVDIQSDKGSLYTEIGPVTLDQVRSVGEPGYDAARGSIAEKAEAQLNDPLATARFEAQKAAKESAKAAATKVDPSSGSSQEAAKAASEKPDLSKAIADAKAKAKPSAGNSGVNIGVQP